ncbi:MAG: DUF721 domain-containing protein [Gammaproteobacteria bacterium]|nr:DUF721 domain-containing protein [Gammaproteobacteria bacterium]
MKSINGLINASSGKFRQLVRQAGYLEQVNRSLQIYLEPALRGHCIVANIRKETLVLQADSPAWASRLRFLGPSILQNLSRNFGWENVSRTKVIVRPPDYTSSQSRSRQPRISPRTAELLHQVGEDIDDDDLREAFLRLAHRGE